ncbi:MAG: hypothetical protein WC822_02140 [Candidatus Paceibacterota bacterium]|jgi:hypothetical protein
MKKIIDFTTKEEIKFTKEDLPILVHGKEHSGASLLSITVASLFQKGGQKLCIFTAYPMAKEEFLKQIDNPETIFYLEYEKDFEQALKFQTIIIQSGNIDLFIKAISNVSVMKDRIIFIKNVETINVPIFKLVLLYPFIISGNLELNPFQLDFKNFIYSTKILFNPFDEGKIPPLQKYQAFMRNKLGEKIIIVN